MVGHFPRAATIAGAAALPLLLLPLAERRRRELPFNTTFQSRPLIIWQKYYDDKLALKSPRIWIWWLAFTLTQKDVLVTRCDKQCHQVALLLYKIMSYALINRVVVNKQCFEDLTFDGCFACSLNYIEIGTELAYLRTEKVRSHRGFETAKKKRKRNRQRLSGEPPNAATGRVKILTVH